ncbi:MAG: outer membrane lipoprotein chaperone LolA [Gammaproteobacteria bacterium]|nr:outer membrane lipoprotein chaperone LolA [Gammaproteobacteria bacterium]
MVRILGIALLYLVLGLASFSDANGDTTAAEHLAARMAELEQLEAGFSQRLIDGRGMELRRTRGRLWAERPDRFRWEVEAPFAEVLIGDGETLWLWDPDLEQVTVRPYDERLQATPARLLSGAVDDLLEAFDVDRLAGSDGSERFTLWPRAGDALFERLEFKFEGGQPRFLVIHDSLGQRTDVELTDVRNRFADDADRFRFDIPEGADVIRETAESARDD